MITFKVEIGQEADGRWLAEVVELPGVFANGATQEQAVSSVRASALGVTRNEAFKSAVFGYFVVPVMFWLFATPLGVEAQQSGKLQRIAILTTSSPPGSPATDAFMRGLRDLGYIGGPGDFSSAFGTITRAGTHAVLVVGGTMLLIHRPHLSEHALKAHLPMMCPVRQDVEAGCLMSYGAAIGDLFRSAARLVDRILKGTLPADLPVEQPTKFELVINLKTAKTLGVTIPQSVLLRADAVVE